MLCDDLDGWDGGGGGRKSKREKIYICMLLLSHFSSVRPCATPWTAAHQAPLSTEFSRQEYWNGLPFPSPIYMYICVHIAGASQVSHWVKNLPAGDSSSISGLRRSPAGGRGSPLHGGAWRATVHKVAESDTMKRPSPHAHT